MRMDGLLNTGELKKEESLGNEPLKMLHKEDELPLGSVVNTKDLKACTPTAVMRADEQPSDRGACLGFRPITPNSDQESILDNHDAASIYYAQSTLSTASSSQLPISSLGCDKVDTSCQADSPHTPREGIFDPFAAGPDDMALAPNHSVACQKLLKESRNISGRRLSFSDNLVDELRGESVREVFSDVEKMSEEMILESLLEALLEVIILKQTEAFLAENHHILSDHPETNLRTPPSPKLSSSGAADSDGHTCPGAPLKPVVRKSRNIDTVRRRLEL